jgi:hypothetical protein
MTRRSKQSLLRRFEKRRDKVTKEEIQKEYGQGVQVLGERAYRFFLPALEVFGILQRLLHLNQEMHKLIEKEKEGEKVA